MDPLRLERGKEALHGRVVQAIAASAHRWLDAMPLQYRPIRPSGVLGGIKRSSQHLDGGSCDGEAEAAIGSVRAGAITVTRSATGGGTRGAATVLGSDRGRPGE